MIKVGIKFGPRSSREDFEKLVKKADFVELYGKVGFDYSFIKQYSKPVTVHAPHSGEGVNLADKDKVEFNKNALEWARKTGDEFESNTIIIHGELLVGEGDSLDNTIDFLKKNFDERYCIENMPYMSEGFRHIGTTPDDIARVMKETGVGFCLDLAHAAELAMYNNEDVAHLIKKFLGLSPRYYHLSDAKMDMVSKGLNEGYHHNLGDGDLDINLIRSLIPKDSIVALETGQKSLEKQFRDIEILRG